MNAKLNGYDECKFVIDTHLTEIHLCTETFQQWNAF